MNRYRTNVYKTTAKNKKKKLGVLLDGSDEGSVDVEASVEAEGSRGNVHFFQKDVPKVVFPVDGHRDEMQSDGEEPGVSPGWVLSEPDGKAADRGPAKHRVYARSICGGR